MARRVSEKTKIKQRRGTGHGASYKPWIRVSEIPGHLGVHHNLVDWKHGRQLEFVSDGELFQYLILRWDDNVVDIREQYPLDLNVTTALFEQYANIRHPSDKDGLVHMTSDLLVDYIDGHQEVYSVKNSRKDFKKKDKKTDNILKKLWIERKYWIGQGVEWTQVYRDEMNRAYADNISAVVYYWQPSTVTDKVSLFKFLVAHKQLEIDMKSHPIDALEFHTLANEYITDEAEPALLSAVRALPEHSPEE